MLVITLKKKKKLYIYVLFVIFLIGTILSCCYFILYKLNEENINEQIESIEDIVVKQEVIDNEQTEIAKDDKNQLNPYTDYVNMKLIDVNFDKLKKINPDVRGWIIVNGTKVNYPFVQANDNKYYLKHSFDKSYNRSGWVFLDYRNNLSNFSDKNTIIYAHNMRNKTMFGTLSNILSNGWLKNSDNYVIKLSTEYENTLWQVFSVYHIPKTSDYIRTDFNNDDDFEKFANMLLNRSMHDFNTSISKDDKILTLSTCYNTSSERLVLHAKLVKRMVK